jgi:Trypsin-co-occurring domain 1
MEPGETAAESYVRLDLGDGQTVGIVAADFGEGGLVDARDMIAPLSALVKPIESLSKAVLEALKKAEPTSVVVELDFSVAITSGGVMTVFGKAAGSAAVKATLTWAKSGAAPAPAS